MFNSAQFSKTQFIAKTATVAVPALSAFFNADEPAEFEVRGLTGNELAQCNEAALKRSNIDLVIQSLQLTNDHKSDLQKLLGHTQDLAADTIKRLEMLNVVFPGAGLPVWIKLCDAYPVVFYEVTNKILELTGQGKAIAKPEPSGIMEI